jgi:2-dehydro-3-deoxyphosphogluconate aldolase/(4S)-4-hydroxy-2-oxoglutarate aldolase
MSPYLLDAANDSALPLLPGAATASEAMSLLERGYRHLKFFPAVPAGGHKLLGAWASPLPQIRFCPTGGISLTSAADFLALPNVLCVGGSWLTPADKLAAGDWAGIELLAREAAGLRPK